MASFADVESKEPEFSARVRACFDAHGHKILATLRADGSPRVSGIEARLLDRDLWLAGMPRSVKFDDLRRDPRMALHSGSDEPDSFRPTRSCLAVLSPSPTRQSEPSAPGWPRFPRS